MIIVWIGFLWDFFMTWSTTRKTLTFEWCLQLNFSCKWQFVIKIPLLDLDKSHVILIANNRGVLNERKNQQIQVHPLIPYILSHTIKMQQFWSLLRPNDMLPRIPIFNYLKCILLLLWNNLGCLIHMLGLFI
jgi:hypothetical protein